MKILPPQNADGTGGSHIDHDITDAQLAHILEKFADRDAFFRLTFDLPADLGSVPCNLHGPRMGDAAITDAETCGTRTRDTGGSCRLVARAARMTTSVTVIAGPAGPSFPCVLYTAFGGPITPRQPGDEDLKTPEEIKEAADFWADHALSE